MTVGRFEVKRGIVLTHLLVEKDGEQRQVLHVHFTAWPDHGVPKRPRDCISVVELMRKCSEEAKGLPIVHCSAGVGRTGVVLAIDIGMDQMAHSQPVDVMAILQQMREDRCAMIQSYDQLLFTHTCLERHAAKMAVELPVATGPDENAALTEAIAKLER